MSRCIFLKLLSTLNHQQSLTMMMTPARPWLLITIIDFFIKLHAIHIVLLGTMIIHLMLFCTEIPSEKVIFTTLSWCEKYVVDVTKILFAVDPVPVWPHSSRAWEVSDRSVGVGPGRTQEQWSVVLRTDSLQHCYQEGGVGPSSQVCYSCLVRWKQGICQCSIIVLCVVLCSISVPVSLSISLPVSFSLSFSLCISLSLSFSHFFLSISLSLYLSFSLSISHFFLSFSLSFSLFLSFCLSFSLSLSPYLSHSLSSFFLALSLSLFHIFSKQLSVNSRVNFWS